MRMQWHRQAWGWKDISEVAMKKKRTYLILLLAVVIIAVITALVICKKIKITPIFAEKYKVTGVDVSHYQGIIDWTKNPPLKDEVAEQLSKMLDILEEHYQAKPIIYTTYQVYYDYIKGAFEEYPLWIRNVYYQPLFLPGNKWTFWQYSDTAVLEGYQGSETYIDKNVFRGTQEELEEMLVWCAGSSRK